MKYRISIDGITWLVVSEKQLPYYKEKNPNLIVQEVLDAVHPTE